MSERGILVDCSELFINLDKLHTTDLCAIRIKKNLYLDVDYPVFWCRGEIQDENAVKTQKGKNWYIDIEDYQITVNAFGYTFSTAHKVKR